MSAYNKNIKTQTNFNLALPNILTITIAGALLYTIGLYKHTQSLFNLMALTSFASNLLFGIICSQPTTRKLKSKHLIAHYVSNVLKHFYVCTSTTVFLFLLAILMGAPLLENYGSTLLWAMNASVLSVSTISWNFSAQLSTLLGCICTSNWKTRVAGLAYITFWSTMAGSWLASFAIPLDWDRPWQLWPIPNVLGAYAGYTIGTVIFILFAKDGDDSKLN